MSIDPFRRTETLRVRRSLKPRVDLLEGRELKTAGIPAGASLIRNAATGEVDVWETDSRRHYVSLEVYNAMGRPAVANVSQGLFNSISRGNDFVPVGMLIRNPQTGEIDLWESDQERHYISADVYAAMGRPAAVNLSVSQFNSFPRGGPV